MKSAHKKQTILYVLKMLKNGSNENHLLSYSVMARTLTNMGLSCDRRTISRDIDTLIANGFNIVKKRNVGCYLINNDFSVEDVDLLKKAVLLLDVSTERKVDLIKKVNTLINIYERN